MKKLISKIHWKLYLHYSKKARKYWLKFIEVKRYNPVRLSAIAKAYLEDDVSALYEAYYGVNPGYKNRRSK